MKKIISIVLALTFVLSFAACAKDTTNADAGFGDASTATGVKVIDIPLTEEEYAYGVDKNQPELLEQLNAYIAQIQEDGTIDEIMNHYFGDGTPVGVLSAEEDASKDQLIIATNAEFAPFEYMDGETYYGVDIEIMKGFADSLGKELVIKNMDFDSILLNVQSGYSDIAAAGLTKNEAREEYVTFSTSYYNANQLVIVLDNSTAFDDCTSTEDMEAVLATLPAGTKIGCQNGTTGKLYIEGDEDWGFAGITNATAMGYANGSLAVTDLINGNVAFVIIDEAPAKTLVEKFNAGA